MTPRLTTTLTLTGKAGGRGRVDPLEHGLHREVDVVHGAEDLVVEGVEADRDPPETRVAQRLRLLRQEGAVRRQRQVESRNGGKHLDEALDIAADQRLAAREADLLDAEACENAGEPGDLLESEQVAAREEGVVAAVDLLRHAVDAAEVAAVRDRDPEVAQRPVESVFESHTHTLASLLGPISARNGIPPQSEWR